MGSSTFPTIFTPQGDGNVSFTAGTDVVSEVYNSRQYLPRKGTETDPSDPCLKKLINYSRQYLPRKGTETCDTAYSLWGELVPFPTIFTPQGDGNLLRWFGRNILMIIPDNIYPARGRKQMDLVVREYISEIHSRQYLPRKGTETFVVKVKQNIVVTVFPTIFTPQGDGNKVYPYHPNTMSHKDSRQYLPRKGTETE